MKRKASHSMTSLSGIESRIFVVRGHKVMFDSDLAQIYGVETRSLVQAVKRNVHRFPADFMFQLTWQEWRALRSQFVISKGKGGRRYLPYVFTEHGAVMAANLLNSAPAVAMSVYVVRAFIKLREVLSSNKELAKKLADLERKLAVRFDLHEEAIVRLFTEIRGLLNPPPSQSGSPKRRIGFHED